MASPRLSSEDKTSQPTQERDKFDKYRNERYPGPPRFKRDPAPKQKPELKTPPEPDAGQDGTVQGEQRKEVHGPSKKRKSRITTGSSSALEEINEEDEKLGALDQKANDEPNTKK